MLRSAFKGRIKKRDGRQIPGNRYDSRRMERWRLELMSQCYSKKYTVFKLMAIVIAFFAIMRSFNTRMDFYKEIYRPHTNTNHTRLFIYVDTFDEGIAGWTVSVTELIIIAKTLNAAFVEPCIQSGRLRSCKGVEEQLRLSDIFDMSKLKLFHNLIITYEEFQNATSHEDSVYWFQGCHYKNCKDNPSMGMKRSFSIEAADDMIKSRESSLAVIHFTNGYRKLGWGNTKYNGYPLVPDSLLNYVQNNHDLVIFKKEHHEFVHSTLQKAGIKEGAFSVIQWRAELTDLDYITCANHIVSAKEIMSNTAVTMKDYKAEAFRFFIITPLHKDESLAWNELVTGDQSQKALQILLDNGFLKFEILMADQNKTFKMKDKIFGVMYDMILASIAEQFSTCDPHACHQSLCYKCNWKFSSFIELTESIRQKDPSKETIQCWPEEIPS